MPSWQRKTLRTSRNLCPFEVKPKATGRKLNNRKLGVFMPSWQKRICELRATFAPLRLKTQATGSKLNNLRAFVAKKKTLVLLILAGAIKQKSYSEMNRKSFSSRPKDETTKPCIYLSNLKLIFDLIFSTSFLQSMLLV